MATWTEVGSQVNAHRSPAVSVSMLSRVNFATSLPLSTNPGVEKRVAIDVDLEVIKLKIFRSKWGI